MDLREPSKPHRNRSTTLQGLKIRKACSDVLDTSRPALNSREDPRESSTRLAEDVLLLPASR